MSLVTAINPLTGVKAKVSRDGAKHAARDALAALVIEDAAFQGNPDASDFVGEANAFLGASRVHRLRAKRLRKKATKAAAMGAADLSQEITLAAEDEQKEAERLESSLIRAVRESHQGVMGYVSPEEQKLLNWWAHKDQTSSASLGKQFEALSQKMISSAWNFGADGDEDEEVPLEGIDEISTAVEVLGGDFEAVYGAYAFDDCYGLFKASKSKLKARLKRKRSRLRKVERKLAALEDAGKGGLRVKFFQMRVQQLEKAISRIKKKIGKVRKTHTKVKEAEVESEVEQAADTENRKEAAQPDLAELDAQEEAEEARWIAEAEGGGDFGSEEFGEALDEDLFAACDLYGMSERRASRIKRRVDRLKARLPHVTRERRRARIERRIDRLEAKLESAGMTTEPDQATEADAYINVQQMAHTSTDAGDSYIQNYGYPKTRADPSLYFGSIFGGDSIEERQPYLGFFLRRAAHYGVAVPNGHGDQFGGFWDGIKSFFSKLGQGTAKVAKATGAGIAKGAQATGQAVRTQWSAAAAARAAASTHGPAVRTARGELKSQQESLRQQRDAIQQEKGPGIRQKRRDIREEKKKLRILKAQQAAALRQASQQAGPGISTSRKGLRAAKKAQRRDARAARKAVIASRKAERRGGTGSDSLGPLPAFDTTGFPAAQSRVSDFQFAPGRSVAGAGGWSYLQQADGTIHVTAAPPGHTAGQTLTSGPMWTAITAEIGPYSSAVATVGYDTEIDSIEDAWGW